MIFQFQLIFVPTGTLCLMLFNQQTFKHVVSRTRYAITFSQFGICLTRPIEQHVAEQETKKSCLSEKKSLEKRIYDNLTFIQRACCNKTSR